MKSVQRHLCTVSEISVCALQWRTQDFGGAKPGGALTYYLANFSRKLHENEEILGGGGASLMPPPLDPPLA